MFHMSHGQGLKCSTSNLSNRRNAMMKSGDRISLWDDAVVVDRLYHRIQLVSLAVVYVYIDYPLSSCHRGHGLVSCRLLLSSKDSILPAYRCDMCKPSFTHSRLTRCTSNLGRRCTKNMSR